MFTDVHADLINLNSSSSQSGPNQGLGSDGGSTPLTPHNASSQHPVCRLSQSARAHSSDVVNVESRKDEHHPLARVKVHSRVVSLAAAKLLRQVRPAIDMTRSSTVAVTHPVFNVHPTTASTNLNVNTTLNCITKGSMEMMLLLKPLLLMLKSKIMLLSLQVSSIHRPLSGCGLCSNIETNTSDAFDGCRVDIDQCKLLAVLVGVLELCQCLPVCHRVSLIWFTIVMRIIVVIHRPSC